MWKYNSQGSFYACSDIIIRSLSRSLSLSLEPESIISLSAHQDCRVQIDHKKNVFSRARLTPDSCAAARPFRQVESVSQGEVWAIH